MDTKKTSIFLFIKKKSSIITKQLGLDRVVFTSVSGQLLTLVTGPITLYFIGTFFSKIEQGYYYTFASVLALQSFLELGLGQCITNVASHEFANLQFEKNGRIYGDSYSQHRLISLTRLSIKWYSVISVLFFVLVGTGGYLFFSFQTNYGIQWAIPWWSLCFVSGINIITLPILSLLEGCNQYLWIAYTRIIIKIGGIALVWLSITNGAGLYTASLSTLITLLLFVILFYRKWKGFLQQVYTENITTSISWKEEIFPFQWRIAVGWVCGYFTFGLFNPVLFAFQGPVVAGQMGMTMVITSSLANVASTWGYVKVSTFGMLVSKKKWIDLDELWIKSTIQSLIIAIIGSVFFLITMVYIKQYTFGDRFLGYKEIAVLCVATIINQIIFSQNLYMRAHRKEPFLKLSILNAILTGSAVYLSGRYFNVFAVCVVYCFFITLAMVLASSIFIRRKKEWHV